MSSVTDMFPGARESSAHYAVVATLSTRLRGISSRVMGVRGGDSERVVGRSL